MADMDLSLMVRVQGAAARELIQNLDRIGATGIQANRSLATSADRAAHSVRNIGRQGKFARDVLEAFVLYRGFVVLQEGAMAATRALIDLQHQVAIVTTQLDGLQSGARDAISGRIVQIGQRTGVAFSSLAKAEFEVVSANIALADSYEILELAAKAAVTGGLDDVELAFNAALSQVNAFNLSNEQFGEVFDKQFNLVKRGIFTYEQFATVVGTVSEAFASMGQDIETANASVAALSQIFTGKQLERGATGLRNAVLRLGEAREDFEALGVAVVDANGDFRNFIDVGRDLERVLAGMTEAQRARAIKDLFPDERERRGINAFLTQLDEAEQFYVEQKFAVGDLDEAYAKVNDTLFVQAGVLRNDLIPAFDGFVDFLTFSVKGVNELSDAVPGLTTGLLSMAAAMAAVQAASTFGPGVIGAVRGRGLMSAGAISRTGASVPIGANPFTRRFQGLGSGALTVGAGSAALGGALADPLSGAIGGAAIGSFGGLPGIAIGAVVGGVAGALGQALRDEAPDVAESFADRFTEALVEQGGDIAAAFLASSALEQNTLAVGLAQQFLQPETLTRVSNVPMGREGNRVVRGEVLLPDAAIQTLLGAGEIKASDIGQKETIRASNVPDVIAAYEEFQKSKKSIEEFGTASDRATAEVILLEESLKPFADETEMVQASIKSLIGIFDDYGLTTEQANEALKAFRDEGPMAMFSLIKSFETALISSIPKFQDLFQGEFGLAAEVFGRIENAGDKLASTFTELNRLAEAKATLDKLAQITVPTARQFFMEGPNGTQIPITQRQFDAMQYFPGTAERTSMTGGMPVQAIPQNLLDEVNKMIVDQAFGAVGGLAGLQSGAVTAEQLFSALFPPELVEPDALPSLGATGLADALLEAADMVDQGLIDPLGFTGDALFEMGKTLTEFNKTMFKVGVLEEIQRIAQLAGKDTPEFEQGMRNAIQNLINSSSHLSEVFADPSKLADLLANIEFGDFTVDQSQDFNIVVRLEGAFAPGQTQNMAQLADAIALAIRNNPPGRGGL